MNTLNKTEETKFTWLESCLLMGLLNIELKKERIGTPSYNWLRSLIDKIEILSSKHGS